MRLEAVIHEKIQAVCPIDGMSFGQLDDKSTWIIRFSKNATEEQKIAAQAVLNNFVWDRNEIDKAELRDLVDKYKDDLLYRKEFKEYKDRIPSATFLDFIIYLKNIAI